jgi:Protein of unknown function (DUF2934)
MQDDSTLGLERGFKIGGTHGYRIEGDTASLNADLAIVREGTPGAGWALQLWACEQPYEGGLLRGTKVAEVALPAPQGSPTLPLEAETFANIPASRQEYCMVLVLASGEQGTFERVHDFANYPKRERFVLPYLEGAVGYAFEEDGVVLEVERAHNPRPAGSLSGSMTLELWALPEPYAGGALDGVMVARADLGQIAGQRTLEPLRFHVPFEPPPAGTWHLALVLREWTAAGFATRDCCNFSVPFAASNGRPDAAVAQPEASAKADAHAHATPPPPSHDEIARAAYYRWVARGGMHGGADDDWHEAERELLRARAAPAT